MGTFFTPVSSSPAGRKCNLVFTTHLISFLARTSKPRPNSDTSALKTKIITKTNDKIVQSCKKTTFDILKCLAARLRGHKGNWLMIPVYSFLLFVSSRPYYRKSSIKPPPPPSPFILHELEVMPEKNKAPGGPNGGFTVSSWISIHRKWPIVWCSRSRAIYCAVCSQLTKRELNFVRKINSASRISQRTEQFWLFITASS